MMERNREIQEENRRFVSVDALRGFSMIWILGGDFLFRSFQNIWDTPFTRMLAEQMVHVPYEGFHFYDMIFPLFLFIVGVSVAFSVPKSIASKGMAHTVRKILIRSLTLFVLGVIYMGGVSDGVDNIYLVGVLQRIAVAYLFAALLFCFFGVRTLVVISVAMLLAYWAAMALIPVPGFGVASYEQGQNLAYYLDQLLLFGQKFEGTILSTLGAVPNALIGVFAGILLGRKECSMQHKVYVLFAAGVSMLAVGYMWSLWFPIAKALWSSSYVLVACGYSAILLGVFIQIIEIWNQRKAMQPMVWVGMNSITLYLAAAICSFRRLSLRFVGGEVGEWLGAYYELVVALITLTFVLSLAYFLYVRRIFLRL